MFWGSKKSNEVESEKKNSEPSVVITEEITNSPEVEQQHKSSTNIAVGLIDDQPSQSSEIDHAGQSVPSVPDEVVVEQDDPMPIKEEPKPVATVQVPDTVIKAKEIEPVAIVQVPDIVIKAKEIEPENALSNTMNDEERRGLTSEQVTKQIEQWGYNELPVVNISLWWVFLQQFMGTMPYMLEICIIISGAVEDWADFGIIIAMLCCNASLGFMEQLKSAKALAELTDKMEKKIATVRDGSAVQLLTRLLVPGDVVLLVGGCEVPADVEWLEGDVLSIDTAALTGEPLPRKYPSEEHGKLILCGATVKAGEAYGIVRATGTNTEIGKGQADILKDKTQTKTSLFEERILFVVKILILTAVVDVIIIFFVQGFGRGQFAEGHVSEVLLACLAIVIASIPIALPLVLQVTMALGAAKMATEYHCVVTSLPALQDISSMSVLCSDKTGTLTTAKISIHAESVWTGEGFTQLDVALYASLSSSRDKKEDAIDRSVINYVDKLFGQEKAMAQEKEYKKTRSVGFNPIYKRVLFEYTHPVKGKITVAKGLPNKVLDTADGGEDDAEDQWKCDNVVKLRDIVKKVDADFSKAGYKTLGIAIKLGDGPFQFVGVLPMLDPPRHDSAQTIRNLRAAGIEVKMCTGDHLNIAKETARLIGLGVNIHAGSEIRDASMTAQELIREANGFAQVLPRDKREVVLVLKDKYKLVVGMTGDGVNDAPALSAAQCGIAVDDATDAAKNAAAIILTSPGLSAIYAAVVESRRIFRKLKAYATYRFAASVQIVIVLTLLIYISDCAIDSLFIVLLALFNDLTMLPIAYDLQVASKDPEEPNVLKLITMSVMLGVLEAGWTLIFAYGNQYTGWFMRDYALQVVGRSNWIACSIETQAIIWLQMFIASEFLIFSARSSSYMWCSIRPSEWLMAGVFIGCLVFCLLAGQSESFGKIPASDIMLVWAWDLITLIIVDCFKVHILVYYFKESTETLPDIDLVEKEALEGIEVEEGSVSGSKTIGHAVVGGALVAGKKIGSGGGDIELGGTAAVVTAENSDFITGKRHDSVLYIAPKADGRRSVEDTAGHNELIRMERYISSTTNVYRMKSSEDIRRDHALAMKKVQEEFNQHRASLEGNSTIQSYMHRPSFFHADPVHGDVRGMNLTRGKLLPNVPSSLASIKIQRQGSKPSIW